MDADTEGLTLERLERVLQEMADSLGEPIALKPVKLWVHPSQLRAAAKLLGWLKGPIRKARSMRARKRALYWRTTK